MNKKKLTLFIALSIIIVITIIVFLTGGKAQASIAEEVKPAIIVEEKKPELISGAAIEVAIEEEKEEIIIIPSDAAEQAWFFMKEKGWSDNVRAGIMANMVRESGSCQILNGKIESISLNPATVGDSGTSYGLCQWHSGRMYALFSFCGSESPSIQDQINYLEYDLKGYNIINSEKSCGEIAYDFCVEFERPANKYKSGADRKSIAPAIYDYFVNK